MLMTIADALHPISLILPPPSRFAGDSLEAQRQKIENHVMTLAE